MACVEILSKMKLKKGFTLIEVLIASLVLSVGLLGVLTFFPIGMQRIQAMILERQAVFIANNYMVALKDFVQNRDKNSVGSGFDDLVDKTPISMEYLLAPERVYKELANSKSKLTSDEIYGKVLIRDADILGLNIAAEKLPLSVSNEKLYAYEYEISNRSCWVRILFKTLRYSDGGMDLNHSDGIAQARFIPFAKVFRITVGLRNSAEAHDFWTMIGDYQLEGHRGFPYGKNIGGLDLTIPGEATPTQ